MAEAKIVVYAIYLISNFFTWICVEICVEKDMKDGITIYRIFKFLLMFLVCIIYNLPKFDSVQMYRNLAWLTRTDTDEGLWTIALIPDVILNIWITSQDIRAAIPGMLSLVLMSMSSVFTVMATIFIGYRRRQNRYVNMLLVLPLFPCLISYLLHRLTLYHLPHYAFEALLLLFAYYMCQVVVAVTLFYSLKTFQRNFSIGECAILCQCLSLLMLQLINPNNYGLFRSSNFWNLCDESLISLCLLPTGVLIIHLVYGIGSSTTPRTFLTLLSVVITCFTLPLAWLMLGVFPVYWLFTYLTTSLYKVPLLVWWLLVTLTSILFAVYRSSSSLSDDKVMNGSMRTRVLSGKLGVRTMMRKTFHLSALLIYLPPLLLLEIDYLRMVSAGAILLLVLVECVRKARISSLSAVIQASYNTFLDHKDQGSLILSHIYLVLACTFPLFLPLSKRHYVCVLSGLMSVGVGDAAASVGGTLLGRNPWYHGHKKTVEGMLCGIFAQLFMWCLCCTLSVELGVVSHWPMMVAIVLTSLMESFTDQVDNLVLPPYMCSILLASTICDSKDVLIR